MAQTQLSFQLRLDTSPNCALMERMALFEVSLNSQQLTVALDLVDG
jgi:hypothetical protein